MILLLIVSGGENVSYDEYFVYSDIDCSRYC